MTAPGMLRKEPPILSADMNADKLIAFRQTAYECLGRAHDAMFELGDAILCSPRLNSFAELSCSPLFRRQ